jgi:hypothetical protein
VALARILSTKPVSSEFSTRSLGYVWNYLDSGYET